MSDDQRTLSLRETVALVCRRLAPTADAGAPSIENYPDPDEATGHMITLCDAVDQLLTDIGDADEEAAYWRRAAALAVDQAAEYTQMAARWARAATGGPHPRIREAQDLDDFIVGGVVLDADGDVWQGRVISTWDEDGATDSCDAWVCCEDGGWATSEEVLERGPVTLLHHPRRSAHKSGRKMRNPRAVTPEEPGERT